MHKSIALFVVAMAMTATPSLAKPPALPASPKPAPVGKYDTMPEKDLREELKKLQKQILVAERTARQAQDDMHKAVRAYNTAADEAKPDALLSMLEVEARVRKPLDEHARLRAEFDAAKRAFVKLLSADKK
jgi:hypothetical protein